MAETNNAAARLHTIFSRYGENRAAASTGSIVGVWSKTLGVSDTDQVRERLVEVVALIDELGRQLAALEKPAYLRMYRQNVAPVLLSCALLVDAATSSQLGDHTAMIYADQLNALDTLAAALDDNGVHVEQLSDDSRAKFREQITEALDAIRADTSLPARIRQEIIARLHEILWALDHLDTVGAEDAIAAAERIGFIWLREKDKSSSSALRTAVDAAAAVWAALIGTAETVQAVETFRKIWELTQG